VPGRSFASPNTVSFYSKHGEEKQPTGRVQSVQTNQLYAPNRSLFSLSTTEIARIQKLFDTIDFDCDGSISREELDQVHLCGGHDFFDQLDLDHDGEITCYEFESFFSNLKTKCGEATLDILLAYLMTNATCVIEEIPVVMTPIVQLFLQSEVNDVNAKAQPIASMAEFEQRVKALFDSTVSTGCTATHDDGSLSLSVVNALYGPANGLFAELPASFTASGWLGLFERLNAGEGAHRAAAVIASCERHLNALCTMRQLLGSDLHKHRVVGAVQVFPSRPPPSKPAVTSSALAAASPKSAARVDHSEEQCNHCLSDAEAQTVEELFELLDLDGNGMITMDEVNYLGNDSGIFAALDLNHDEMVTTEELQTFMGTIKVEFGTTVLDLILKYLSNNAAAHREGRPTTVHPIECLFLEPWQSASVPAVASPNASPDAQTVACLVGLYQHIASQGPVTSASIRAVHGSRADELVCDEAPILEAAWMARADQLVKRKGLSYVSSLANDLNSNVTKQEACKIAIESM